MEDTARNRPDDIPRLKNKKMMVKSDVLQWLEFINPSSLNYQEWVNVGMALKYEGYTAADWDDWSSKDGSRYHPGECFKKWSSFDGQGVTGGTIYQMAIDNGWTPGYKNKKGSLEWDDEINCDLDYVVVNPSWLETREFKEPSDSEWNPVQELITYLETLFDSTEHVGYVTKSYDNNGKYVPSKGNSDRTAGKLIEQLNQCNGDIGSVFGDYNPDVGAWIRFNPLDGKGVKNENVIDYRYALVESDSMDIEKQDAVIKELELPVACLLFSGKKSLHAIVKIEATSYQEYQKRVDYLYKICQKNGLEIDVQNKNPSRLSRMPGVTRNGHKQFLIDTNIGKKSWNDWYEWIEGVNDDLPEPETLADYFDSLPALAPELINGVLRQGHKLLLAGPSKAGKSFALIELCIAIAEGKQWLSWDCAKGRVLYVNLELDRASCLHRFKDVYQSLNITPNNVDSVDIWNLRGKSVPMDKLAPKLIRRAAKKGYIAIVIDPIYKVITGDENSADQMAHFTNQFDKICTELGTAVIYCHHHSKGSQGNKKSMDRASGSGVFARDPDALIDLVELELDDSLMQQQQYRAKSSLAVEILRKNYNDYYMTEVSQDDELNARNMEEHLLKVANDNDMKRYYREVENRLKTLKNRSAWRIEGTLREFAKFEPINVWFDYPTHQIDDSGILNDVDPEGATSNWKDNFKKKKAPEESKESRLNSLEIAYSSLEISGKKDITYLDLTTAMNKSLRTVKRYINESDSFKVEYIDGKEATIKRV